METDLILFLIELYGVAGWLASSSFAGDPKHFIFEISFFFFNRYQSLVSYHQTSVTGEKKFEQEQTMGK